MCIIGIQHFDGAPASSLWKMVTMRYCELGVTEFPFVFVLCFALFVLLWAYAHAL